MKTFLDLASTSGFASSSFGVVLCYCAVDGGQTVGNTVPCAVFGGLFWSSYKAGVLLCNTAQVLHPVLAEQLRSILPPIGVEVVCHILDYLAVLGVPEVGVLVARLVTPQHLLDLLTRNYLRFFLSSRAQVSNIFFSPKIEVYLDHLLT